MASASSSSSSSAPMPPTKYEMVLKPTEVARMQFLTSMMGMLGVSEPPRSLHVHIDQPTGFYMRAYAPTPHQRKGGVFSLVRTGRGETGWENLTGDVEDIGFNLYLRHFGIKQEEYTDPIVYHINVGVNVDGCFTYHTFILDRKLVKELRRLAASPRKAKKTEKMYDFLNALLQLIWDSVTKTALAMGSTFSAHRVLRVDHIGMSGSKSGKGFTRTLLMDYVLRQGPSTYDKELGEHHKYFVPI